jgi:hypothetical protein
MDGADVIQQLARLKAPDENAAVRRAAAHVQRSRSDAGDQCRREEALVWSAAGGVRLRTRLLSYNF